jgi:outer membrane protein OmpA-like peptidoglycan-associated protein
MTSWLPVLLLLQASQVPTSIPLRPGLTVVQAVQGDTLRGNAQGDYEAVITVVALSASSVELLSTAFVRNSDGRREWLRVHRAVPLSDLRSARTQILGFATTDALRLPGTTALGPSLAVIDAARDRGTVEVVVRNYADRLDNPGTLRRIGAATQPFPVLLNGRRVTLQAIRMRGELGQPGHLRPWDFWFLDHPTQPLTLKVSYGAEGAPESSPPEWMRQIVRIDVPGTVDEATAGSGAGNQGGPAGAATPAAGQGVGGGSGTGGGRGIGNGAGDGAGAEMARDLAANCRVQVPGVYFEFASDQLNPASAPRIREVADLLRRHPEWPVTIEGHTDSIGGSRYNQDLSERRAGALKRELVGAHGIPAARLSTRGYGLARPLEPNTTLEGRARNRRVELVRPC